MIVIGEKINGTRTSVAKAIKERDEAFIEDLARRQVEAGAHYLDINAGTHPDQEPEDMVWLINTVQGVSDVTLCLDSANPQALATGIKAVKKTPMINSLSGEKDRLEGVLPLACEHKTELVVLAMDDNGIPKTGEDRVNIIRNLVNVTRQNDLPDENLFIDPLIAALATDTESGNMALETMRRIKEEFPRVHLTAGISNISYGLPERSIVNRAFVALAIATGLDSVIINPEDRDLRGILFATELVLGKDSYCLNYIKAYRSGEIGTGQETKTDNT
jgi:cobalamin-dependent methionine synthase I